MMELRVNEANENKSNIIVGGDFNCRLEGMMEEKISKIELINSSNVDEPSRRNATTSTRIDYMFYRGTDIKEAWGGPREMVTVLTDHMPIFGMYKINTIVSRVQEIRFTLQPDLKRHDAQAKEAIKRHWRRWNEKKNQAKTLHT